MITFVEFVKDHFARPPAQTFGILCKFYYPHCFSTWTILNCLPWSMLHSKCYITGNKRLRWESNLNKNTFHGISWRIFIYLMFLPLGKLLVIKFLFFTVFVDSTLWCWLLIFVPLLRASNYDKLCFKKKKLHEHSG